jgi:hypothetical protein
MARARQISNIVDERSEEVSDNENSDEEEYTSARRVSVRQSPYLAVFCEYHPVDIIIDTGATGNMIRESTARKLKAVITKSTQAANQADGTSPLKVTGETRLQFTRGDLTFEFEGLVVMDLDVEILAGIPFMEQNDIAVRPARQKITFSDGSSCYYGKATKSTPHHVRRAHVIRAPNHAVTIFPGDYIEATVPYNMGNTSVAIEPRADTTHPQWPQPDVTRSIEGIVRVPNLTGEPMTLKRHEHICQILPTYSPKRVKNEDIPKAQTVKTTTATTRHSAAVRVDPDNILPTEHRQSMVDILTEYDSVFTKQYKGYNGAAGPFQAQVNMGPTKPPQRKGRIPQYSKNKLVTLQEKFDELEQAGVFAKPEDVGISVEYVNPSFLIAKSSGGHRLVTAFADVGRYSKPQPCLMPDVDSTLRQIAQWKYICISDLSSAFYQIPLQRESMKYCGVVTPFKGTRVYARCAMGMPGSESALEELMCRVLGDLQQEGIVTKLADDLYCGGNTPDELVRNWKRVLDTLLQCRLCLSASKTIIAPKKTTILGWIWETGKISASQHRISSLATCSTPKSVKEMRSFIGAYKVLARVIPGCSTILAPLDETTAGKQSQDHITWSDELQDAFKNAQTSLQMNKAIILPRPDDQLWIVTDAGVRNYSLGATLYVRRDDKLKLAGFFSAKLQKRQILWLPCELEALAIAVAVRHFSPFIIQSVHKACILTDSKPCVQAYEKLCRGEFSVSPRVSTFLSAVSRYQASVQHIAGSINLPSDHASRNAPECTEPSCQVCSFIQRTESCVVIRSIDIKDIIDGKKSLPFLSRSAWASIQSECKDLRRTHAHLRQGTRPSKKLTNIRDVKRYLNVASIASDGLLVVRKDTPLESHQNRIIVPRHIIDGILTAIHIQLDHPSAYQMKKVVSRYLYALDLDKAIDNVTEACHPCAALKQTPNIVIPQSTSTPPDGIGISFAADILRRDRQFVLVLRECVTSFTTSCIVSSEKHDDLRDAIICLCCEMVPLDGPLAVIRVDPAPGFQALVDDPLLLKYHIQLEVGRIKNINHNPVAERAVQELETELIRQISRTDALSPRTLSIATARLNSRIRNNGISSREMWFQRDQYSNEQIPIDDVKRIKEQYHNRCQNHKYSENSKCPHPQPTSIQVIGIGDIVYIHNDKTKLQPRPRYIVVTLEGEWCTVRKFVGNTLRQLAYRVKLSECYKVPHNLLSQTPISAHTPDDSTPISSPKTMSTQNNTTQQPEEHRPLSPPIIPPEIIEPLEAIENTPNQSPIEDPVCPTQSDETINLTPLRRSVREKKRPIWWNDYAQ